MNGDAFSWLVELSEAGRRLDSLVAARLPNCSRSHAAEMIRKGFIRVDGLSSKPSHKAKFQERIEGRIPPAVASELIAEPLALEIAYEDRHLLVVNKPAGMVVHPAAGHSSGTLVHGILHHCPDLEGIGHEKRPGIVHRLDKETSGLIVVAKNTLAHEALSRQFKERSIHKQYLALVHGRVKPDQGKIDLPVGRHPVDRKKMSTKSPRGRDALTLWHVQERFPAATLLAVDLKTGRTHQIRVHCQAMGHPIVGDPVYHQKGILKEIAGALPEVAGVLKSARRQMLHAWQISFSHPASKAQLLLQAPPPEDMMTLLAGLRRLG